MRIFRKKEEKSCCCGDGCGSETMKQAEMMKQGKGIKILGSGCKKCVALEETIQNAVHEMNIDISIEHVSDFAKIASYGVMTTPAFVLNGKVVSYGKILSIDEVKSILSQNI